ncbi:MAG: hypothetical protein LBJ88_07165 [Campylobacteraceae bacterium]|jgi:hypothetical protein|nr:hypothetical protein [Campylobacteraceae bacterium]
MRKLKAVFILLLALFLTGCCVDENGNIVLGNNCEIAVTNATFKCNGASCNGMSEYNGSGVNIWSYKNGGSNSVDLSVSMYTSKDITIVYTNEGNSYVAMPSISINTALRNEISPYEENLYNEYSDDVYRFIEPDFIRDFEPAELIEQSDDLKLNQAPSYKVWSEGNKYNWNVAYGSAIRATTLRKQLTVNGRTINLWVEDSEYANGGMGTTKINSVASYIGAIYTGVVSVAGEPWGTHGASNLIPSGNQPLDIVFFNTGNSGIGGYFGSYNNYKKSVYSNSNEAVVIFIHTRMNVLPVIAHELTHAIDFYQRFVVMGEGNQFNAFLGEMRAVMMEDVIASRISYNNVGYRYKGWLNTPLYQQDFSDWKYADSSSYNVAGSLGAFLLRQYGIDFFKTLFKTRSDLSTNDYRAKEINILDKAIKVYDSRGLAKALRNWGASIAMFPTSATPKGFGYPARSNDNGFNLEAFDDNSYRSYRKLPTSSPSTLAPHAHFPFLRKPTASYTYEEQFRVPSGVSISIVVK